MSVVEIFQQLRLYRTEIPRTIIRIKDGGGLDLLTLRWRRVAQERVDKAMQQSAMLIERSQQMFDGTISLIEQSRKLLFERHRKIPQPLVNERNRDVTPILVIESLTVRSKV